MKKMEVIFAGCAVLISGLFLLFNNSSGQDTPILEHSASQVPAKVEDSQKAPVELEVAEPAQQPVVDDFPITKDEFDQLSQEQQDEMLEEFVLDFREKELELPGTTAEEKSLSLEIFNRPYMQTLTEREFAQLSPEDQKKALDEIFAACREVRGYAMDIIAEANSCLTKKDYANAEAYFVHSLEIGRELSVNKEGMFITRWAGTCFKRTGLNGLVKLYTQLGEHSKVQMAWDQLSEVESEREEMRNAAKEIEARS